MSGRERHVVLIGLRGCGKSSTGRALARLLGRPFIDTDERVEVETGRSIAELFAEEGEAAFRALEAEAVSAALQEPPSVIAVGGGAVMTPRCCTALRSAGLCFWLSVPVEDLHRRLLRDPRTPATRPPLTNRSSLDELRELAAQRNPRYRELATHILSAAGRSPDEVAREILRLIRLSR